VEGDKDTTLKKITIVLNTEYDTKSFNEEDTDLWKEVVNNKMDSILSNNN
jgi:hypothetical protein